jgi:hypothetical protein
MWWNFCCQLLLLFGPIVLGSYSVVLYIEEIQLESCWFVHHLIVIFQEVSFMLPPLLGLLLECAKKTDQTVVSIALGALVHLIEVGGHQFSDGDWETLLKSIRYFLKFYSYQNVFCLFVFHILMLL